MTYAVEMACLNKGRISELYLSKQLE